MKKSVLKITSIALGLCVATALTSCHSGEAYEAEETTVVNNVTQLEARTLSVHTNVAATVKVGSETKTGQDVEFANPAAAGTIQITADGRQAKTINYNFKDGAILYFDVELESAGKTFTQAEVETGGATVTNGTDNAGDNDGVEASFAMNGASNTGATGDYSITVFTPADGGTAGEDVAKGQSYAETPMAIDCKPDGAVFDTPIKVALTIPGSAGYDVKVKSGDEVANIAKDGDKITADIPHFSVWDVILNITCGDVTTTTKNYDEVTVDANAGTASVKVDYGYEADAETANSVLAKKLLKKMFGTAKREITKKVSWNKVEGTATVKASQTVKNYSFTSGEKSLSITVYGKVTTSVSIETTTPEEVKTHGGGSN